MLLYLEKYYNLFGKAMHFQAEFSIKLFLPLPYAMDGLSRYEVP